MSQFLTLALVNLVALLSPGPDFLFVSQTAVSRSKRQALFGVVGITLGCMVWAAFALLGLQLLLHRLAWLQQFITVAGGAYLVWMGAKMLRGSLRAAPAEVAPAVPAPRSDLAALRAGLLTNLSNPKAVVFFSSVFSALLGDGVDEAMRWSLWLVVAVETFAWFTLVATLFALPAMRRGYRRIGRWIDGCAGAIFVAFGLRLMLARRVS